MGKPGLPWQENSQVGNSQCEGPVCEEGRMRRESSSKVPSTGWAPMGDDGPFDCKKAECSCSLFFSLSHKTLCKQVPLVLIMHQGGEGEE